MTASEARSRRGVAPPPRFLCHARTAVRPARRSAAARRGTRAPWSLGPMREEDDRARLDLGEGEGKVGVGQRFSTV